MSSSQKEIDPLHLQSTKFENLEMRRMSISRLQSLSKSWRNRHHEQPLGIPGHKRPVLPQRRWNCQPGRCLSRKCSSSKLQLVPGQRESDLEVDQGWHLWDLMEYKGDSLSFRLWVSKEQFPLDSGQMSLTQRCTSSQYHANIQVESIPDIPHHTTENEFKSKRNSPTSLTVSQNWKLEMRRMSMSKLQSLPKSWRQRHHEQPLVIPGHKGPSLPHRRWNCEPGQCLSRKRSSSKLQPVPGQRESDLEVDQSRHLWVCETSWNTKETQLSVSDSEFPKNKSHWIQGKCRFLSYISSQYHANIPVESISHHTTQNEFKIVQDKKQFTHFTHSQLNLKTWKCEGWASANYKAFQEAGDKDTLSSHLESRDTTGLCSLIADGIGTQLDACHGSVLLQSFS